LTVRKKKRTYTTPCHGANILINEKDFIERACETIRATVFTEVSAVKRLHKDIRLISGSDDSPTVAFLGLRTPYTSGRNLIGGKLPVYVPILYDFLAIPAPLDDCADAGIMVEADKINYFVVRGYYGNDKLVYKKFLHKDEKYSLLRVKLGHSRYDTFYLACGKKWITFITSCVATFTRGICKKTFNLDLRGGFSHRCKRICPSLVMDDDGKLFPTYNV